MLLVYRNVDPTSKMRVEIRIKSGHLLLANKEQTSKDIDLQNVFNNYWTSKASEITVQGEP